MINYAQFTPLQALMGGAIMGIAALLLLLVNGRISGISGIVEKLLHRPSPISAWAWVFIVGLLAGSVLSRSIFNSSAPLIDASWWLIVVAGLLVGFGSRLASGCTSGHGICGIGRFALRSLIATPLFIISGVLSVYLLSLFGL